MFPGETRITVSATLYLTEIFTQRLAFLYYNYQYSYLAYVPLVHIFHSFPSCVYALVERMLVCLIIKESV